MNFSSTPAILETMSSPPQPSTSTPQKKRIKHNVTRKKNTRLDEFFKAIQNKQQLDSDSDSDDEGGNSHKTVSFAPSKSSLPPHPVITSNDDNTEEHMTNFNGTKLHENTVNPYNTYSHIDNNREHNDYNTSYQAEPMPEHVRNYQENTQIMPQTHAQTQSSNTLLNRVNYAVQLLEEKRDEKTGQVTEELILYGFLGVFIIYAVDSFVRVGKYYH